MPYPLPTHSVCFPLTRAQVYPKLEALGTLHTLLLQDRRMLVVLSRVADVLAAFRSSYDPAMTIKDVEESRMTELVGALLNEEGPAPSSDPEESSRAAGSQLLLWDDACEEGMEVPQLSCGGFSVVTAVKRSGFLLRASPEASVVAWEGALYGFVNEEEAEAFAASPREFMTALLQLVVRACLPGPLSHALVRNPGSLWAHCRCAWHFLASGAGARRALAD